MQLVRPTSLDEAVAALGSTGAELVAGGTALQLTWEAGKTKPRRLVDLSRLDALRGIHEEDGHISIGAITPLADLSSNPVVTQNAPLLSRAVADVAGPSVREMGTLGGNIGWGMGCLLPALLALGADVIVANADGQKTIELKDQLGSTDPGVLVAIHIPKRPSAQWTWHKTGLRAAFTPGIIAVAGQWRQTGGKLHDVCLAAGSGATPPQRISTIEKLIEGTDPTNLAQEQVEAAIHAPSDILRTGAYRKRVGAAALLVGLKGQRSADTNLHPGTPAMDESPKGGRLLSRAKAGADWHVRPDLADKLDGKPVFLTDMRSKDMLVAKIVRAPCPHARILSIETSKAESLPGVHAVVTHKDVRGSNAFGIVIQDQPAMCGDVVRYEGDPVAAIAADNAEIAQAAAELVDVAYERLPIVSDPLAALDPTLPKLHPEGNLRKVVQNKVGDVEKAFADAAHIVEDIYETPRQMHGFMETEGGFVEPTDNGGLIVHVGGQYGARDRLQLSRILNIPEDRIEVVSSPTGGAFGGKDELTVQPALALLALKTRKAVRIQLSRAESARAGIKRNPFRIFMKTACDANGKLVAQHVEAVADGGAHASLSLGVIETAMEHACGPYVVPNIDAVGRLVSTNNGTCGAFRGFGCNEMTFAVESQIERLARMVGIDGPAMRRINMRIPGMPGYLGQELAPTERLSAMLDSAEASPLWAMPQGLSSDGCSWIGTGMALCYQGNGLGTLPVDEGDIELALAPDGKIEARYGMDEIGQGLVPAAQSSVADALGIARDDVRVVFGDTARTPDTGSTTASRGTYMVWKGAHQASPGLRRDLLKLSADHLGIDADRLKLVPGGIVDRGSNSADPTLTFTDLAQWLIDDDLPVERVFCTYPKTNYTGANAHFIYISGAVVARVAIDRITGMVHVPNFEQHSASGPILDTASYLGQMEGAASQGLGMTLTEHIQIDEGHVVNGNFDTYAMPSFADRPSSMTTFALEELDVGDPYGPRGVGELGIAGVAPAVTNAIANALALRPSTAWPTCLPLSPETLLDLMARDDRQQ